MINIRPVTFEIIQGPGWDEFLECLQRCGYPALDKLVNVVDDIVKSGNITFIGAWTGDVFSVSSVTMDQAIRDAIDNYIPEPELASFFAWGQFDISLFAYFFEKLLNNGVVEVEMDDVSSTRYKILENVKDHEFQWTDELQAMLPDPRLDAITPQQMTNIYMLINMIETLCDTGWLYMNVEVT